MKREKEDGEKTRNRVSPQGFSLDFSEMSAREIADIKRELTVSPIVHGAPRGLTAGGSNSFALWRQGASRLYVPKFYGLSRFGTTNLKVTIPDGDALGDHVRFKGTLRPEQLQPVKAFQEAADDIARMGGILSLPCGCGKTVLALYIISLLRKKTLIVVHKNFLLEQWNKRIEEFLPGARVGTVKAKIVDVHDKDVVIASLQSLSMKSYDSSLFSVFGLFVIDEVHHTGAEVFSKALQKTNFRRCLGLSATVNRKDGMTKVFTWYIGDVVYEIKTSEDTEVKVLMLRFQDGDLSYCEEPENYSGTLNTSRMINNVTRFAPRTEFATRQLSAVMKHNISRKALVLSDRLDHLDAIRSDMMQTHGIECGMYVGGMKPGALEESEKKNVILATYSFASEGFDVPGMDTLVLASPKTDIEQSVGRILRQKPKDRRNVPLILDIVDGFSVFQGQAKKRRAFYNKRKYEVTTMSREQEHTIDYATLASSSFRNNTATKKGQSQLKIDDTFGKENRSSDEKRDDEEDVRFLNEYGFVGGDED